MFIDGVNRNLPAVHPVAKVALDSVLAAMQVGVAVLAIAADVGEHPVDVAFLTAHVGVQAAQRKAGFGVVELRFAANWPPRRCGMALLAGYA